MKQAVRFEVLSYELGVLTALAHNREDQVIKDSLESIILSIDQDQLDGECFLDGLKMELTSEEGCPPAGDIVIDILLEYLGERHDLIVGEIIDLINEGVGTAFLSEEAIAAWASDVFSQVTDYESVKESDISFMKIAEELQGYDDLDQSNLEGEINRQLQAAGYIYSVETCRWAK